ncbi:MAG: TonB-dependent receptor [Nannocystaceae bacterium]
MAAQMAIVSTAEAGPTDSVLVGVIRDARSGEGVEGAVVIVTGEKIQGERTMSTDTSGLYRIPNLPPGVYDITVLHKDYGEGRRRKGLQLRSGVTIRVDISMIPAGTDRREIEVAAPTVDVGSSSTGLNIDKEMSRRVPIALPTGKGGANRSFESVAEATPTAANDTYGTSVAGTTSPENKYYVDGLSVNDPGFGLNGTGLSVEFLEEVRVEAGGYMPEFGRSTGGIVTGVTKRGSNEFHGGIWATYTPGQLQGQIKVPQREGQTIQTERNLNWLGDTGFDLGGRLIKDKLWFYGGVSISHTDYKLTGSWNRRILWTKDGTYGDGPLKGEDYYAGDPRRDPVTGYQVTERIAGTTFTRRAQGTTVQALGKLTYAPAKRHTLDLLGIYAPQFSGGGDTFGMDQRRGLPEVSSMTGDFNSLAHKYKDNSADVMLTWKALSADGKWDVDTTVGWHHQLNQRLPVDGTAVGANNGLAAAPGVIYRRNVDADGDGFPDYHPMTDFVKVPSGAPGGYCDAYTGPNPLDPTSDRTVERCPAQTWTSGGPGFVYSRSLDRLQARTVVTRLAQAAGHHTIKFGADFEYMGYSSNRGYTGGTLYRESTSGTSMSDYRQYGFLTSPDHANILPNLRWDVYSTTIGGFVQDSWAIMDKVTLNAGARYDAQHLFGGDKQLAMALPNQISPRVGLIWDPTQSGKAKIFANYARFYQSVPLNLADRAGSGEPSIVSSHVAADCDPTDLNQHTGACQDDANRRVLGDNTTPDSYWILLGAGKTPIDPKLKPQSSDEVVVGGDYEIFPNGRLGLNYTHRWLNRVIEDMSRDEATTYFIGNPGYGIAKDFPKANRVYDALVVFLDKRFADHWLISTSYTLSFLRGNIAGLFRPETGQLDPNINSDFDLISLLENKQGYLPGDTRHVLKVFSAGEIVLPGRQAINLGGGVRASSGGPTNYLGSHALYGADEAFILPRGSGERLPWTFRIDTNIGYTKELARGMRLTASVDIFNIANFQQVIAVDQTYTLSDVNPIKDGTVSDLQGLKDVDGADIVKNPNFGKPIAYQSPRMFRFGLRLSF